MPAVLEQELIGDGSVFLTEDEQDECESYLRVVMSMGDGERALRGELAASFKRGIISACMMGRAQRFLHRAASSYADGQSDWNGDEPDFGEMAYDAAAKACSIFPVPINLFDFGCLLQEQGRHGKARVLFKEFLKRARIMNLDPVEELAMSKRDIAGAIEHARQSM